jgi:hypothetical protein
MSQILVILQKLGGISWAALGRFLVSSGLKGCPFSGMSGQSRDATPAFGPSER